MVLPITTSQEAFFFLTDLMLLQSDDRKPGDVDGATTGSALQFSKDHPVFRSMKRALNGKPTRTQVDIGPSQRERLTDSEAHAERDREQSAQPVIRAGCQEFLGVFSRQKPTGMRLSSGQRDGDCWITPNQS